MMFMKAVPYLPLLSSFCFSSHSQSPPPPTPLFWIPTSLFTFYPLHSPLLPQTFFVINFFSYSPLPPSPLLSLPFSLSYPFPSFSYSFPSSHRLSAFADEVQGLDQYAIRKFGEAFDVVPRTLAENSGGDPTTSMHTLHGSHIAPGTGNNSSHFLFWILWTVCFVYFVLSSLISLCFT